MNPLATATRFETPCGTGPMVWHVWGEGAPLVLLHGGSGSWTHWIRNVEPLAAAGRRVIVPDLPGFGDSSAPAGVRDADGMVQPVADGLRRIVGDIAVDVVGFSFGGMLGGLVAAAHDELVRHLVIAGAPGLGLRQDRLKLYDWRHLDDEAARNAVHRRNLGILMLHDPASITDEAVAIHAANVARDRMRRRKLALSDILLKTLPTLSCRFDAVYGSADALYAGREKELQALFEPMPNFGELVLIPGGGHWVQFERPDDFNRTVLRLL